MRLVALTLTLLVVTALTPRLSLAQSSDYSRITHDRALLQALAILDTSQQQDAIDLLRSGSIKIMFKNMTELGRAYQNHDALTVITADDQQIIFINVKHQYAPPPALAALIRHETMHNDRENSLAEETTAWHAEGQTWAEMLSRYPTLRSIRVGQFPLVDRLNAINILRTQNRLGYQIRSNVAYQDLPEHSPGF